MTDEKLGLASQTNLSCCVGPLCGFVCTVRFTKMACSPSKTVQSPSQQAKALPSQGSLCSPPDYGVTGRQAVSGTSTVINATIVMVVQPNSRPKPFRLPISRPRRFHCPTCTLPCDALSIIALVCSAITLFGCGVNFYSLFCSIPAFILAIVSTRDIGEERHAIMSIVCSSLAICCNLLLASFLICLLALHVC